MQELVTVKRLPPIGLMHREGRSDTSPCKNLEPKKRDIPNRSCNRRATATRIATRQGGIWDKYPTVSPPAILSQASAPVAKPSGLRGQWSVGDAVPRWQPLQGIQGWRMPLGQCPAHSFPLSSSLILCIRHAASFS